MIDTSITAIFISVLIGLAITLGFYYKEKKFIEAAKWVKVILPICRFFVVFTIVFLLFGPLLNKLEEKIKSPELPVFVDNSSSVFYTDTAKRQQIKAYINLLESAVGDQAKIRLIPFSKNLEVGSQLNFKSGSTNIGAAVEESSNLFLNKNIPAGILISDGIITEGKQELLNPGNYPIYTIGVGDTAQQTDARIDDLFANEKVFAKNDFPVEVNLSFNGLNGVRQEVEILYNNKRIKSFSITPNSNRYFKEIKLKVNAETAGVFPLKVVIRKNENEKVLKNNTTVKYIEVLDHKQKLLVVEGNVHPDFRAVKNAFFGVEGYELVSISADEEVPDLKAYNAIVLLGNHLKMNEIVNQVLMAKVSLIWFTGVNGVFNNELLRLKRLDDAVDHAMPLFNNKFKFITFSDSVKYFLEKVPPVNVPFGKWIINGSKTDLLNQSINGVKTNYPLLTIGSFKNSKYALFFGEGIWKWQFFQDDHFGELNDLILKTINYLSVRQDPSALKIAFQKKYYSSDQIIMKGSFYNESMQLDNNGELKLTLKHEDNSKYEYEFNKVDQQYELRIGSLSPGLYSFSAELNRAGEKQIKSGQFIVELRDLEFKKLQADHSVLKQLSNSSKGEFYHFENRDSFLQKLKSSKMFKSVSYFESLTDLLIKNKWILYCLIGFLTIEWFVRKWQGTI